MVRHAVLVFRTLVHHPTDSLSPNRAPIYIAGYGAGPWLAQLCGRSCEWYPDQRQMLT